MTAEATRPAIPDGIARAASWRSVAASPSAPCAEIAEALAVGGVRAFELTLNEPTADAFRALEAAARVGPGLGIEIGAGTVLTGRGPARDRCGATFLVMPHLDPELVAWSSLTASGIPGLRDAHRGARRVACRGGRDQGLPGVVARPCLRP